MSDIKNVAIAIAKFQLSQSMVWEVSNGKVPDYSNYHICAAVVAFHQDGLTISKLAEMLPFSEDKAAYKLRYLVEDGWIELHNSARDGRSKLVSPTQKLLDAYERTARHLRQVILGTENFG